MEAIGELGVAFLSLVIGFVIAERLRLPTVAGVLVMGALIGPYTLGLVQENGTINAFGELGAALLLFIIGLEFSISKILRIGLRAVIIGMLKISLVFVLVYEVALLFGLPVLTAILIGVLLSFTSTTIFLKLVGNSYLGKSEDMNLLIAVLILEDLVAVFMLAMVVGVGGSGDLQADGVLISIFKSLTMLAIVYLVLQKIVSRAFDYIAVLKNEESLIFAVFTTAAIFAILSSIVGFQASVGAFLAGSVLSSVKESKRIERLILPFGLFFSSFFFLYIGMLVNPASILGNLFFIGLIILISIIVKFLLVFLSFYLTGKAENQSVYAGILMITTGEFSLILAKEAAPFISFDLIGLVATAVLATALASSIALRNLDFICSEVKKNIPKKFRVDAKRVSGYTTSVFREVEPGGGLFGSYVKETKKILFYSAILILANSILFFTESVLEAIGAVSFWDTVPGLARITLHILISSIFVYEILRSVNKVLSQTLMVFRGDYRDLRYRNRLIQNAYIIWIMLVSFFAIPLVASFLRLPGIFNHLALVPLAVSFLLFFDCLRLFYLIRHKKGGSKYSYRKNGSGRQKKGFFLFFPFRHQ